MKHELVHLFRDDPYDKAFRDFNPYPHGSPGCTEAESKYRLVLTEGVIQGVRIVDPLNPEWTVAKVDKILVTDRGQRFEKEWKAKKKALLKNPERALAPQDKRWGVVPGAISGLVNVEGTLFVCTVTDSGLALQRPILTSAYEKELKQLLQSKLRGL